METTRPAAPAGLRELLTGIIDYAGTFPPAELPLQEAVSNYRAYQEGPDAWIVGKFVCPVSRLDEVDSSFKLCVTGRGGETLDLWLRSTIADLDRASAAGADLFEVRLPDAALTEGYLPAILLDMATHASGLELFFELPFGTEWEDQIPIAIGFLQESGYAKAKIRTGGLTADAFPSDDQVAVFVAECARKGVPFKATAGLHQPLRRYDDEIGVTMQGFLNVFCAAAIAMTRDAPVSVIRDLLQCEDRIAFSDDGFNWKDYSLTTADIIESRRFARSFGSCSVDEPLEGLAEAGYL